MDWDDFQLARQLLLEERVGVRVRGAVAEEDAEFAAAASAIRRGT
jgi:hypothetical protein